MQERGEVVFNPLTPVTMLASSSTSSFYPLSWELASGNGVLEGGRELDKTHPPCFLVPWAATGMAPRLVSWEQEAECMREGEEWVKLSLSAE